MGALVVTTGTSGVKVMTGFCGTVLAGAPGLGVDGCGADVGGSAGSGAGSSTAPEAPSGEVVRTGVVSATVVDAIDESGADAVTVSGAWTDEIAVGTGDALDTDTAVVEEGPGGGGARNSAGGPGTATLVGVSVMSTGSTDTSWGRCRNAMKVMTPSTVAATPAAIRRRT